jgi:hypothetical protein
MVQLIKREFVNGWELSESERDLSSKGLEVNVIFTDPKRTAVALRTASDLARGLNARVRVIAVQAVPFAFPLSKPPVDIAFQEKLLLDLVNAGCDGAVGTTIQLYLCRNALDTLAQVLPPNSVAVIGGSRWWFSDTRLIAKMLRSIGHQVILDSKKSAARDVKRRFEAGSRAEEVRKHA